MFNLAHLSGRSAENHPAGSCTGMNRAGVKWILYSSAAVGICLEDTTNEQ